ncbi:NifB/NifX family molybdenum-iron cluster-binding protein [Propionivibrio limicola]|uniref:NifB/NifX family molybdenum-iron cluster-binding protein n=1 Tax=Propionivibrio limicola TaxID=167645 RepID=UPI0012926C6C|nr:NifB/NifX family molybdenum-iron cluster-binding protein [Propionivibrio limicola]
MKLCIPISAPNGLESAIESHLPNAEHLFFFDTETREHSHLSLREQSAGAGQSVRIDAVLCGSFDSMTKMALSQRGIKAFGTEAKTVSEAIAQFENGELYSEQEESGCCDSHEGGGGCCGGKNHEQGADHAHGGGCGGGHGHASGGCQNKAHEEESKAGGHGCGSHGHGHGGCGGHDHDQQSGGCGCGDEGELMPMAIDLGGAAHIVAVSCQNKKTVTDHAGRCRNFWVYDISNGQVVGKSLLSLPIEQSFHETKGDQAHPLDSADVLLTGGMSPGLQKRLLQRGIKSLVTTETDPDQAVADLLEIAG